MREQDSIELTIPDTDLTVVIKFNNEGVSVDVWEKYDDDDNADVVATTYEFWANLTTGTILDRES